MKEIEILNEKDLEYFHKKAETDPGIHILKITAEALLDLDILKLLDYSEEKNMEEIELQKWIKNNQNKICKDNEKCEMMQAECTEKKLQNDIQIGDSEKMGSTEELLSQVSNNSIRVVILKAIDLGLEKEEIKAILKDGRTVEEMELICHTLSERLK